ncbi:MAG: OmpA family protein [Candidatus Zixiibacteriota bacterium]
MRSRIIIVLCALLLTGAIFGQVDLMGARAKGVGGAFTALANDANATVWNPAGMESFREKALTLSYSNLFLGIGDNMLNEGYIAYVGNMDVRDKLGSFGLSYTQYMDNIYSQGIFTLGYAKRLYGTHDGNHLSLGLNAKFIRSAWNDANVSDGFDATDPMMDNSQSIVPSADVGLLFVPAEWLRVGVAATDLLQPDVSLSGSGTADENIRPMKIRGGLGFKFGYFKPMFEAEYLMREVNGESIKMHGGLEVALGQSFAIRGGYDRQDAAFGLGYMHQGEKVNWGIDYAADYPVNELGNNLFTSHHVSFNLMIQPPPIPLEDLEIVDGKVEVFPKQMVVGDEVTIRAQVVNKSEIGQKKVRISCYYQDDEGMWNLCAETIREDFEIGEEKDVTFRWQPPADGHYTIYVSVDDDGTRIPEIRSRIDEFDEENNTGVGEVWAYRTPEGIISPRDNKLAVSKLTLYQEEEPIIPMVFFEKNSAKINARYNRMLQIIADRLSKNPDVQLSVKGYYSPMSDDTDNPNQLADQRAKATVDALVKNGAPRDRVSAVTEGYDRDESRAGVPEDQFNKKSLEYQLAENRRSEIEAWFKPGSDFLAEVPYATALKMDGNDLVTSNIGRMKSILSDNPEVIILCDAYADPGDSAMAGKVFTKVTDVASRIKEKLGDPELAKRVYIKQSFKANANPNVVMVFPISEGLVYRPKEADHVIDDYEVEGEEMNRVNIEATVQAGVDSFAVSVVDQNDNLVRTLAAGKGQIPEGLSWDWRDNSGELLDFDKKYFTKLEVVDKLGEEVTTTSDTMAIQVTKEAKRIESLVIVEFLFDEDVPSSKFLASRVEYVADRLIKRASKGYTRVNAVVTGHTDSIGAEYANIALSKQRAQREYINLRRYMMYLLDIDSQDRLDTWLEKNNVELSYKGYGETDPYEIIRWAPDGTREKARIGDNSTPEGRTVNRRVLLDMESQRIISD